MSEQTTRFQDATRDQGGSGGFSRRESKKSGTHYLVEILRQP